MGQVPRTRHDSSLCSKEKGASSELGAKIIAVQRGDQRKRANERHALDCPGTGAIMAHAMVTAFMLEKKIQIEIYKLDKVYKGEREQQ